MALEMAVAAFLAAAGGAPEKPALMPWPASLELLEGELPVGSAFRVQVAGEGGPLVEGAVRRFEAHLARQTGLTAPSTLAHARGPTLEVRCDGRGQAMPHLGMDESYTLRVTPGGASLRSREPWGVLRGLETLLQLVTRGSATAFRVPAVAIEDRPRFGWRGLVLDSARHFMPVETVKRTIEGMAAVKLNVLHLHLTDDQGFRIESRRHPELHQMGSDGLFYTQAQVEAIVAHAAERGIRVYPEFDMPGHVTSWLVSHPELASAPGPYEIEREWGVFDRVLDPSKEEVYRFLDGFLGEMARVFPDPYLHVGGDEVDGRQWRASERIAAFRRQKGLEDDRALQGYFSRRVARIVASHGKKAIGWDEVLLPGLAPDSVVVQSWRGPHSLWAAARQGHAGILSSGYYLDLMWPAARHYLVDPWDEGVGELPEADRARVLGGEAAMWSEFASAENLDARLWPRAAAIAERLWSPREARHVEDMYARLDAASRWLEWRGLDHRASYDRMLQRLAGPHHDELRALADVVEPLEDYQRGRTARSNQRTPLNRLVDAARAESDAARAFSRLADALLADPARQAGAGEIRARLREWQGLEPRLRHVLEEYALLRETAPLAAEASALAAAGLEALDFLERRERAPASWWAARAALLLGEKTPAHGLEVAFRPAIRRLMEACTRGATVRPSPEGSAVPSSPRGRDDRD
jgi:hexosaminidase